MRGTGTILNTSLVNNTYEDYEKGYYIDSLVNESDEFSSYDVVTTIAYFSHTHNTIPIYAPD